jgi:uncharacterized protein (TIGR03083 family)
MDVAVVYRETREHLLDLASTLDDAQAALPVPALPRWTIKDAYAHLAGLCADILDDRMEDAGSPASNARELAERAGKTLAEVVAEWADRGPELDEWIEEREEAPMFVVYDVWTHEQDILGALGLMGERDSELLQDLAAAALTAFSDRFTAEDAPALQVIGDEVECILGEGEPQATLNIDDYELMRILFGRRSLDQIRAADWDGDESRFIPHLHLFPLPEKDLVD